MSGLVNKISFVFGVVQFGQRESEKKKRDQSNLSRSPYCELGKNQGEPELHLGEKGGDWRGSMGRKRWTPQ